MSDNNINLTAPIHAATQQGKAVAAREVFMDGDKETVQQIGDKTHQLEEAIKDITATGGASTANAVSYSNETSGMTAVTAQGAIDELVTKNKSQDTTIAAKAEKSDVQKAVSELKEKDSTLSAELSKKANTSDVTSKFTEESERVNGELAKKANATDVSSQMQTEQERVNTEFVKKFDKESILQESGDAEDKVMSQKAVSTKLSDLSKELKKIDSNTQQINDIVLGVSYLAGGFDAANHVFNNDATYYHTDFIDVSTNVLSLNKNVRFVVYYNESKEYLSHSENKVDNSMLENAAFASVVFSKKGASSLVITSSKKGLIAAQKEATDEKIETLEKRIVSLNKETADNSIKINGVGSNISLLLGTYYIEGGFDAANHVFNNDATYYHTDFIDVSTNVLSLNQNVRFVVYYNESKEYLSHSENKVDNSMLENAAYASVVFSKNVASSLVITSSKKGLIAAQNEATDEKIEYLNKTSVVKKESVNILDSFSVKKAEIQDGIIKLPLNVQNSKFTISSNLVLPKGTIYFSFDVKLSATTPGVTYGSPLLLDINKYTTRYGYAGLTKDKWVRAKFYANIEEECKANFLIAFNNSVFEDGYLYIRNLMITTNENFKYSFVKPNPIEGYLSEDGIFGDSTIPIVWENGGWNAADKVFNTDKNYVHTQFISLENNVLNVSSFAGARFIIFYNIAKEVIKVLDSPSNIEKSLIEDNDYVILVYNVNSIQNLVISNHEVTLEEKIQSNEDRINKLIKESEGDNILNKIYRNRYIMFGFVAGKGLVILGSSNMRKWGLIEKKFFFNPKKVLYNDGQKDVINGFRDPAFIQIDDWFYFTYTVVNLYEQTGVGNQIGFCRTKDFISFEELDNLAIEDSEGTDFKNGWAWAPDFFRIDDKIYIVCAVSPTTTNYGGQSFYHYICEYDYKSHKLSKAFKTNISFIDCHIYYIDGKYYAIGSGNKIYKSDTLLSNSWTSINASASIVHYEAQILTRLDDNRFLLIGQDVYNANDGVNDQHLCYQVLDSLESSFSEKKPLSYDNDSLEWLHTQQRSEVHEVTHATIFDTKQWRGNNNNFFSE